MDIYIIDSGIVPGHIDFGGRAEIVLDTLRNKNDPEYGIDCNGHGTHVGSIAAGAYFGVAKQANLKSIRAFNCNGYASSYDILRGMKYVLRKKRENVSQSTVLNMSFTYSDRSFGKAIGRLTESGVVVVIAAGNDKRDACEIFPDDAHGAIVVGATTVSNSRDWRYVSETGRYGSNYGKCVDVWAPGAGISAAGHRSNNHLVEKSGTSMAAPYVAGTAALILERKPQYKPVKVKTIVMASGKPIWENHGSNAKFLNLGNEMQAYLASESSPISVTFTRSPGRFNVSEPRSGKLDAAVDYKKSRQITNINIRFEKY